jgi:hypothetical protein
VGRKGFDAISCACARCWYLQDKTNRYHCQSLYFKTQNVVLIFHMVPFYKVNPARNLYRKILRKGSSAFFKGQWDGAGLCLLPVFPHTVPILAWGASITLRGPGVSRISHFLNNRNRINGEIPPRHLPDGRTEIPSSTSNNPGKLN